MPRPALCLSLVLGACVGVEPPVLGHGAADLGTRFARVDVVVVGGGPAGIAAAIDAREAGASVLLLERDDRLGGAVRYSGALMTFAGTQAQEVAGIDDSPELLLEDWPVMTGGDSEDPWVRLFAERNAPDVYDWLVELGVELWVDETPHDHGSVGRLHLPLESDGYAFVDALTAPLPEEAVALGVEVTGIVQQGDGRAVGVTVEHDGAFDAEGPGWIEAGAVVMATGGFLRNRELVEWADPQLDTDHLWYSTGPQADGGGHLMLEALGAAWDNPGTIGVYAHGIADPRTPGEELAVSALGGAAWVNASGERFVDELGAISYELGEAVVAQPDHLAWALFDQDVMAGFCLTDPMVLEGEPTELPEVEDLAASGQLQSAGTLEALALQVGLDADTAVDAVEVYNALVEAARSTGEGGDPLDAEPYYAIQVVPVLAKAFGGIEVDLDGRVLDEDQDALPGLYAAGELTGMAGGSLVGHTGFTGSLSAVLLSGRIAGRTAAEECQ